MRTSAAYTENLQTVFLEVVRTQVVFDDTFAESKHKSPFKIIVNPAGFREGQTKELGVAKIGLSQRGTIKFFFEKSSLCDQIRSAFFFHPVFSLQRNIVLPAELLVYFSLPYHVLEKGVTP
ncbi:MAG: hypothetical protein R2795_13645 [Saprospiraceae bacterium]